MLFPRVILLLAFICLATLASGQPALTPDEVDAFKQIAATLGKSDWNLNDPCSVKLFTNWTYDPDIKDTKNVTCECHFNSNTTCHIVSILFKTQNLTGTLPPEFNKLPFLREIDLTRNYLNGTIPKEWGSLPLVKISLIGNRISGRIPKELGNISSLFSLTMEYNQLMGEIPPELGNLSSIGRLFVSSNNLTGKLPVQLAKLTTLKDFRISSNQFVGTIPDFIQNWTHLESLIIQASGLSGPLPSFLYSLTNLTDLRISDLNGNYSNFPTLDGAKHLKKLILRNCNITGEIPDYLCSVTSLKLLDLSFNKLTGRIPKKFGQLSNTDYMYLTGNFLTGDVPEWMLNEGRNIDLSYNNFTGNVASTNCEQRKTNLFAMSSRGRTSGIDSCLSSNHRCNSTRVYRLHINCGGGEVKLVNGTTYEPDMVSSEPSRFFKEGKYWAFSSTGHFLDNNLDTDSYIQTSTSKVVVSEAGDKSNLYMNARLAPISLTYYAFCLGNGNYTVNLHFAEIAFTNDTTYASLGRRFFDIYIQGELVRKDFNIEDEAGGVSKAIVIPFAAVVNDSTLDIRFYWAGKGTDGIPSKGVYGPLISAISVISDFPPPHHGNLLAGAIVGIVLAVLFIIFGVLVILWWKGCLPWNHTLEHDLRGLDLHTGIFSLRQIKAATNNFDAANKIGEGGFGSVYKGNLGDGTIIAVKQLSEKSNQGNREFVNEIGMISALQHPNLVRLYGCCIEGNQLLLVYEYMENNSLARALFGAKEHQLELDWPTRHTIAIGVARGLSYLHEESRLKIVHRDIKATNVLLDKNLNPKISDFGLARLDEEENTHISTRVAGTFGYMAPEYAMRGYLTDKADVYSFGIVLLEIVSGKSNTSIEPKLEDFYLLDWAHQLKEEGKIKDLIDPRLGSDYNEEEVMLALHIAQVCTNFNPTDRPSMSSVVSMLEGREVDVMSVSELSGLSKNNKFKPIEITSEQYAASQEASVDVLFTDTSMSARDLYPLNMESDYFLRR